MGQKISKDISPPEQLWILLLDSSNISVEKPTTPSRRRTVLGNLLTLGCCCGSSAKDSEERSKEKSDEKFQSMFMARSSGNIESLRSFMERTMEQQRVLANANANEPNWSESAVGGEENGLDDTELLG